MNEELLTSIGLNSTQARAYLALVRHGALTPPELAKKTGETRTNAYTVLDKLVELGLAKKDGSKKKLIYRVENPVALEKLVKKHRNEALQREKLVKDSMPALLNFFYTYSEQPGVRFYQGKDGIEEIYNDTLRTGKDIYLLRSPVDVDLMTFDYLRSYKVKRAKYGITTHTLSPDVPNATRDPEDDKVNKINRTWLPKETYTAPVEIDIYGDKVAMISFGEEAMGMIIESPQIAEAMRQIFSLATKGATNELSE
jgi:HTH-type transcriptional regulator, sugar sensing transcriptional regulator